MAGNLRAVGQRLEEDLLGVTASVRPPADETGGPGYLEITDGSGTDDQSGQSETARGDCDDVLAFTTRSRGLPFAGSLVRSTGVTSIESPLAEVVWWTQRTDVNGNGAFEADEPYTIYRRVLLIRPDLDVSQEPFSLVNGQYACWPTPGAACMSFLNNNDVSVQIRAWTAGGGQLELHVAPNSLADLTLRQNRFAHYPVLVDVPAVAVHPKLTNNASGAAHSAFPFALDTNLTSITCLYRMPKGGGNAGQDVLVSNALAFDVQVFDPGAPLIASANSGEAAGPGRSGLLEPCPAATARRQPADQPDRFGSLRRLGIRPAAPGGDGRLVEVLRAPAAEVRAVQRGVYVLHLVDLLRAAMAGTKTTTTLPVRTTPSP